MTATNPSCPLACDGPAPLCDCPASGRCGVATYRQLHVGPPPPRLYRLRDAAGVEHTHTDIDHLRRWIGLRDARLGRSDPPLDYSRGTA